MHEDDGDAERRLRWIVRLLAAAVCALLFIVLCGAAIAFSVYRRELMMLAIAVLAAAVIYNALFVFAMAGFGPANRILNRMSDRW